MRIMLVDDNPDDLLLTRRAVTRAIPGVQIDVARDGQDAINDLLDPKRSEEDHPQMVFLDLKMPRLNGIEVLRRVRKDDRTSCLPIVMLTSSDERADILASYKAGVNSYVRKPVEFDQFMLEIGNAARYWLFTNVGIRPR